MVNADEPPLPPKVTYEQAKEFADEYPSIAERLGGLIEDRMDPMILGLLEGTAFLAARVQQSSTRGQCGRHVHDRLADRDQLLRQQRAVTACAFNRPQPWSERRCPRQQPFSLSTISTHQHLTDHLLVAINHRGGVRSLMRVDPNDEH